MTTKKKDIYEAPAMTVTTVRVEQGICRASGEEIEDKGGTEIEAGSQEGGSIDSGNISGWE